jgi:hypothetical protein
VVNIQFTNYLRYSNAVVNARRAAPEGFVPGFVWVLIGVVYVEIYFIRACAYFWQVLAPDDVLRVTFESIRVVR